MPNDDFDVSKYWPNTMNIVLSSILYKEIERNTQTNEPKKKMIYKRLLRLHVRTKKSTTASGDPVRLFTVGCIENIILCIFIMMNYCQ